jgi:SAM-dependent methyltransferase
MTSSPDIRPISHATTNQKVFDLVTPLLASGGRVVDVGAGEGYFSKMVGDYVEQRLGRAPRAVLSACDLFPEYFRYSGVPCDPIDATGQFPYADGTFDVACSLEVVEHLEDPFHFMRELHRIVRPGGKVFVSTPNLLNINSRLRFLHSGFWLLFDPLPLSSSDPVHTSGHIHPITFYYLAYAFRRAGLTDVRVHYDRRKRSAAALHALLSPFTGAGHQGFAARLRRKSPDVYAENHDLLKHMNSRDMLTARSIIVEGTRPA